MEYMPRCITEYFQIAYNRNVKSDDLKYPFWIIDPIIKYYRKYN